MSPLDIAFHLLKNNKFHPEDEPMSSDDMISYLDEEYLGHIGSKEAEPMEIYQDVMADTPEGRKKQTNIMGTTYDGKPTFNMIPLAGEGQPMVNPHAEIFRRSEPMEIAMRLLKNEWDYVDDNVLPENDLHYIYPNEQMWNDEADDDLKEKTNALWEYIESMHPQDKLMMLNQMDNPMLAMGINTDPRNRADMTDEENEKYINDAIWEMMFDGWQDSGLEMPGGIDYDLGGNRKSGEEGDPVRAHAVAPSQWKKLAGEPMNIAMRLLKEEDSVCPHCRGTGKDPNQKGIPEEGIAPGECEPCDGSGMRWVQTPLDERGFPIESYEEDDPNWQDSIETGEPMDIAMRLLKNEKQWKEEAKFLPTRDLEGQSMGVTEALVSHPNFKLFEEAGHPEDRLEEFFGTRIAEEWRRGRVFEDEWAFREQEEDDQLREMGLYEEPITSKTQDKLDYAPDVFMEHKRLNMKTLPGGGHKDEIVPAFGNVNIRTPAPIDEHNYGVTTGPTMQDYPLRDMEEHEFSPWQAEYDFGEHGGIGNIRNTRQGGFSAQDQMKYTGEPMDLAWRLLKASRQMKLYNYIEDYPGMEPVTAFRGIHGKRVAQNMSEGVQPQHAKKWHENPYKKIAPFPISGKGSWWAKGNTPQAHEAASGFAAVNDPVGMVMGYRGKLPKPIDRMGIDPSPALLGMHIDEYDSAPMDFEESFAQHQTNLDPDKLVWTKPSGIWEGM